MKKTSHLFLAALILPVISGGCATKSYGSLGAMPNLATASCSSLEAEAAQIRVFRAEIARNSKFNGGSALGLLIDGGLGNTRAKTEALEEAADREVAIARAQRANQCPVSDFG